MEPSRARLVEHVLNVQRTIRTCEGCGECCTERHNTVRILPVEAARIAEHLRGPLAARRATFVARMKDATVRYALKPGRGPRRYTCPFLEDDRSCALPFDVKPVACLSFNPSTPDACDMEADRFAEAHAAVEAENAARGAVRSRAPIPVAVLAALDEAVPRTDRGATPAADAEPDAAPEAPGGAAAAARARPRLPDRVMLPRLLSKRGAASRRDAERMVKEGRVTVDGVVRRDVLYEVDWRREKVAVDGRPVDVRSAPASVYVAANKPRGLVTTTRDPEGRPTVMELVADYATPGLAPVGRLDQASAGLLLFTNDAVLADRLLDPKRHVAKTYRAKVRGKVDDAVLKRLGTETFRDGEDLLRPLDVALESTAPRSAWLRIVLREGKNRQIRRHLAHVGLEVEELVRVAFGPLRLGSLAPGKARALSPDEVAALRRAAEAGGEFDV